MREGGVDSAEIESTFMLTCGSKGVGGGGHLNIHSLLLFWELADGPRDLVDAPSALCLGEFDSETRIFGIEVNSYCPLDRYPLLERLGILINTFRRTFSHR